MAEHFAKERDGHPTDGFRCTELYEVEGGRAWRRYQPRQEMKLHGHEYESWVYNGPHATPAARKLRGVEGSRPSRIDIAHDFACSPDDRPEDIIEETRRHFTKKGMKDGISGHGGVNTCYIGSTSSLRRIRIYRKDLQDEAYAKMHGPTLRIELELKAEHAHAAWAACQHQPLDKLYEIAAAHLEQITGIQAFPNTDGVPEIVPVMAAKPGQQVATFLKQHAGMLKALREVGICLDRLVDVQVDQMSPAALKRLDTRIREYTRSGPENVESVARLILLEEGMA
jgi:hypothetical protein